MLDMIHDLSILVLMTGIMTFVMMMIILLVFMEIYKGKKQMTKIPIVIEDRKSYEDMVLGLNSAIKEFQRTGKPIPKATLDAFDYGMDQLEKYKKHNILSLVELLTDPGKRIIEKFLEALEDGKINFKDIPEGLSILGSITDIVDLIPGAGKEIKDLSWDEAEIIVVIIMRLAKEKMERNK